VASFEVLLNRILSVVESEAPRDLFLLIPQSDLSIKLHADGQVPFKWHPVELEVHFIVGLKFVLWSIGVEERLNICDDVKEVVLSWCHDLWFENEIPWLAMLVIESEDLT